MLCSSLRCVSSALVGSKVGATLRDDVVLDDAPLLQWPSVRGSVRRNVARRGSLGWDMFPWNSRPINRGCPASMVIESLSGSFTAWAFSVHLCSFYFCVHIFISSVDFIVFMGWSYISRFPFQDVPMFFGTRDLDTGSTPDWPADPNENFKPSSIA